MTNIAAASLSRKKHRVAPAALHCAFAQKTSVAAAALSHKKHLLAQVLHRTPTGKCTVRRNGNQPQVRVKSILLINQTY